MRDTAEHAPAGSGEKSSFPIVPALVAGAVALFVIAGAVYWFRAPILDAITSTRDAIVSTLGLGVVPIVAWLAVFAFALGWRRGWFRRYRLWLGSVVLLAAALGALAFFTPANGALSAFTLGGEVSLGGRAGQAVVGPTAWLGSLRLFAVIAIGVAVAAPFVAVAVVVGLGRAALFCWVALAFANSAIAAKLRERRQKKEQSQDMPQGYDQNAQFAYSSPPGYGADPGPPYELGLGSPADGAAAAAAAMGSYQYEGLTSVIRSEEQAPSDSFDESAEPDAGGGDVTVLADTGVARDANDYAREYEPAPRGYRGEYLSADYWTAHGYGMYEPAPASNGNAEDAGAAPAPAEPYAEPPRRTLSPGMTKFNSLWDPSSAPAGRNGSGDRPGASQPRRGASRWKLPKRDFLRDVPETGVTKEEMQATGDVIRRTLAEYGIEVEMGQAMPGPRVTMYGLVPGWVRRYKQVRETDEAGRPKVNESGRAVMKRQETKTRVKVDSILSREKDLALALKTPSIRIETPVMGESMIGIEIPNPNPGVVSLRSVMESGEFRRVRKKGDLPVALGKGSGGETTVIDLAKMPHLLVAGATGSGKSACLNGIISSLIMERSPAELRLLLIDPKRVELTPYNGIPHLLTPVVVETDEVVGLLKGMVNEMLNRYRKMEEVAVRNIESYNKRVSDKMPMLVVVIDELADLMMSAAFDVEQTLCRLAQLGRATGIHLVVATQRPSVDVVTGLIKANFPSRISFGVTSQVDSRTILDTTGADKLLGRGDMLYLPLDASRPERVQGVFISDGEVEHLVEFWKTTSWGPLDEIPLQAAPGEGDSEQSGAGSDGADELLDKAIGLAMSHNKLSTSLMQRRLRIGYPRAARLMDELEDRGIVGPSDGSRSRDVIIGSV